MMKGLRSCRFSLLFAGFLVVTAPGAVRNADAETANAPIDTDFHLLMSVAEYNRLSLALRGISEPDDVTQEEDLGNQPLGRLHQGSLRLDSMIYMGPKQWVFWLNQRRVTPASIPEDLKSLKVGPGRVQLSLMAGVDKKLLSLTLSPNQTYIIDSGEVLEGNDAPADAP